MDVMDRLAAILAAERPRNALPAPFGRGERLFLAGLLIAGLAARVIVAALFPSVHHPDETFQYWEQGYRLAFGQGMVPWEYRVGIRSYLVPGALAGVMQAVHWFGGGMEAWRLAIQALLSLLSMAIVATAYAWARRAAGIGAAMLVGVITASWFELIYFSARPLTEVIAATPLFVAAYLLCLDHRRGRAASLMGGALLGLALVVRFQLAPAVAIIALACLVDGGWRRALPAGLAALLVVAAGGLLDWITLGMPFQSIWLNFVVNAVQDKASQFGTQPFFWYLLFFMNSWAGFFVPLLLMILAGVRRAPLLLTVALGIVVAHSLIGHKEYRFVYPALPFLLTLAGIGGAVVYAKVAAALFPRAARMGFAVFALAWIFTAINLAAHDGYRGNFTRRAEEIAAFRIAAESDDICGIGLAGLFWVDTPGYSGLGVDVPIYPMTSAAEAEALAPSANVVVKNGSSRGLFDEGYEQIGCAGRICVVRRPGTCTPQPDQAINAYLIRTDQ